MLKRNTLIGRFAHAIPGRSHTSLLLLLAVASLFGAARSAQSQALPTAEKNGGINAFGAFTFTSPDYAPAKDAGVSVGGDYMLRSFRWGQPAFAGRYSYVDGSTVSEKFLGGGGELHYRYRSLRPYATLLYGVGSLVVPSNNQYHDSGDELLVGGGVDVPVSFRFAVRAEFTYGVIHITGYHNTSIGQIDLTPASLNIGVVYHIK
jgi:hypothetical protein